jgi:hypothetical protein
MFESTRYAKTQVLLTPDDLLLCYTDGLEECVDEQGEMLGPEGICGLAAGTEDLAPNRIIPEMVRAVAAMSETNLTGDDVTILLIRANGASVPIRANLLAPFRYLSKSARHAGVSGPRVASDHPFSCLVRCVIGS